MKSIQLMESELQDYYSFRKKILVCLEWLKQGELSHFYAWGADSETGEGSQVRIWYNKTQDAFYGMTSAGEVRKSSTEHMVYQYFIQDSFATYDEEGIHLVKPSDSVADTLYRHLYKGDL